MNFVLGRVWLRCSWGGWELGRNIGGGRKDLGGCFISPHLLGGCVRSRALGSMEKVVKQHEQLRGGGDEQPRGSRKDVMQVLCGAGSPAGTELSRR